MSSMGVFLGIKGKYEPYFLWGSRLLEKCISHRLVVGSTL
jgi:hypothetical protein